MPISQSSESANESSLQDELTDDAITNKFRVFQRRRGHRYSLDDLLTAHDAVHEKPHAQRVLDLGTGIGSVLLMVASNNPDCTLWAIEAQEVSYQLLTRNIQRNTLAHRTTLVHGDLRNPPKAWSNVRYDLITATPPYFPPGTATRPPDDQKAFARIELRGGVEAYLETASKYLGCDGKIVICVSHGAQSRTLASASQWGLRTTHQRRVWAREGHLNPLFSVWTLEHNRTPTHTPYAWKISEFYARDQNGERTQQYLGLRAFFGMTIKDDE